MVRVARRDESDICCDIYLQAWRGMWFVPQDLHTPAGNRRWMRDVFAQQLVLIAENGTEGDDAGQAVGFLTMGGGTVHNLYVLPGHQGQGVGHALIEAAKTSSSGTLRLWVFEPNEGAIRFYERHGFITVRKTDGHDNEEQVPDRLMAWRRDDRDGS